LITGLLIGGISSVFFIEVFRNEYYNFKVFVRNELNKKLNSKELIDSYCSLSTLQEVPKNSTVIIGHAYGNRNEYFFKTDQMEISNNVKSFLLKNKSKIEKAIFTGDIFNKPSKEKWDIFYNSFAPYFQIIITPGNHDIGGATEGMRFSTAENELFQEYISKKQTLEMPFLIKDQGFNLIIDDSNNGKNSLIEVTSLLEKNKIKDQLILLRHHSNLGEDNKVYTINSLYRPSLKRSKVLQNYIEEKLDKYGDLFIIYGDSKDTFCYKHGGITHIWNGIGSSPSDKILILKEGKIYLYNLISYSN
tara:strand:- start:419 stop:1330 length:912 start_codon:yes stop_codon:yes gene_type:complete